MDAENEDQFDIQLGILKKGWDSRLADYFDANIKNDMRAGMLLPIRKYLGTNRFYNNGHGRLNITEMQRQWMHEKDV